MCLVHDDDGTPQAKHVAERVGNGPIFPLLKLGFQFGRQAAEMMLQRAGRFVDLPAFGIFDAQRRQRGNDDAGLARQCPPLDIQGLGEVHDCYLPVEPGVNRLAVGVLSVAQGRKGLVPDRVRRHQPEADCPIGLQVFLRSDPQGVTSHEGLTAAGRDAQADVGETRQLWNGAVGASCLVVEGGVGTHRHDTAQVRFKRFQASLLVFFQLQHGQLTLIP